jgi:predicted transcriptional regulator
MTRMNVAFKDSLAEELRRLVPRRQRSRFISEAVREKLDLLKQERAVRAAAGIWSSEGRAGPEEEIRALRRSWSERAERLDG